MTPISKHGAGRDRGVRFEFLRMRPHDHMCWVFTGAREFAALAVPFLSEGAALGQRLMYVAENPDPEDMRPLGPAAPRTPCRSRASRRCTELTGSSIRWPSVQPTPLRSQTQWPMAMPGSGSPQKTHPWSATTSG